MSYQSMGDTWSTAVDIGRISLDVVQDPYLAETVCNLRRLSAIEDDKPDPGECPRTAATAKLVKAGIGLRFSVSPIRAMIKVRQNPILLPLAVVGVVTGIFATGYLAGKKRRR